MRLDIAVEENQAHLSICAGNFPYKFMFLDRTTGTIVDVNIDTKTFENLVAEINGLKMMPKVHMKSAINRDSIPGLMKTLCGLYLDDSTIMASNPGESVDVTCKNCLKILKEHNERSL